MIDIAEKVKNCEKCKELMHCKDTKMEPSIIIGHENSQIMVIGVQPGKPLDGETKFGYNYVVLNSRIGKMFYQRVLNSLNLKYDELYVSNLIKCPHATNAEPIEEWADNCVNILQQQIDNLKNLKVIVLLGKFVNEYLTKNPLKTSAKIIKFPHPSFLMRTGTLYAKTDELCDELKHLVNPSFNILDNVVKIEDKFLDCFVYYRNGEEKNVKKYTIEPYFYIYEKDINKIKAMGEKMNVAFKISENKYNNIYNENVLKLVMLDAAMFWKFKRELKVNNIILFESDLSTRLKFLVENEVKYSKERRIGIIDIETINSVDVENTPDPITAITIYDYKNKKYYNWIWSDIFKEVSPIEGNEISFFNNEEEMLRDFLDKMREMNFDILAGWYSNNFDFPYLINRINKIGLDVTKLSSFGHIDLRKWIDAKGRTNYSPYIEGIDLIDLIPVMRKSNCYSRMPASFSLASVTDFYLKNERKTVEDRGMWKKDINKFLKYNTHDVYLVKELNDIYGLIDFAKIIQEEAVNVPLDSVTYNSVVLEYYIKLLNSSIILPDKKRNIVIDGNYIDLNNEIIKIKGPQCFETEKGIYKNLIVFDFSGLYGTIFRTFNISPDTFLETSILDIDDVRMKVTDNFGQERELNIQMKYNLDKIGIIPHIVKLLGEKKDLNRKLAKEELKLNNAETHLYKRCIRLADVYKQIQNSAFGCFGYNKWRLFDPRIAGSITSIARKILNHIKNVCEKQNMIVVFGDTDSAAIACENMSKEELTNMLNNETKNYILKNYPMCEKNYCLNFEYQKTYKKFLIKDSKKKYYGILDDGKFDVKGFEIVKHSTPNVVKSYLGKVYLKLLDGVNYLEIKKDISEYYEDFKTKDAWAVGIELNLEQNLEDYKNKTQHAEAAKYSNKYLKANFGAGTVGKQVYVKSMGNLPLTEYIFITEETELPEGIEIDYERQFEKVFLAPLELLNELPELNIDKILNKNKTLDMF